MKRLSAVSEVVLWLREQPVGMEINTKLVVKTLGLETNHVSAALCHLEDRGFLKCVRVEKGIFGRLNIYELVERPVNHPLRNAPCYGKRTRTQGEYQPRHPELLTVPLPEQTEEDKLLEMLEQGTERALELALEMEALSGTLKALNKRLKELK